MVFRTSQLRLIPAPALGVSIQSSLQVTICNDGFLRSLQPLLLHSVDSLYIHFRNLISTASDYHLLHGSLCRVHHQYNLRRYHGSHQPRSNMDRLLADVLPTSSPK
jgi:hypothetical protein